VGEIQFGGWPMGGWHWTGVDEAEVIGAAREAVELGITTFDTAPVYGFGLGEERLGRALAGIRDRVQVMTKFGLRWNRQGRPFFQTTVAGNPVTVVQDLSPESIVAECEASLGRLGVEVIDCYQLHFHDGKTDLVLIAQVMESLMEKGWIRSWGVCNLNTGDLHRLVSRGHSPSLLQFQFNLLNRKAETSVIPYCMKHGIKFLAYSPLARGLLTGSDHQNWQEDDDRKFWKAARRSDIRLKLEKLRPVLDQLGVSIGTLLLAWTAAVRGVDGVLAGCRTRTHVRDASAAAKLQVSPEVYHLIARLFC